MAKTKVIGEYDVVVCGGGVAGVAAAVSSARNGAKVALIEKEVMLGGLATLGLIVIYLPLCDGMGNQVIFGLGEELLKLSVKYGADIDIPDCWKEDGDKEERKKKRYITTYNPYLCAIAFEELLLSLGVDIIYDTLITGVDKEGGYIKSITVHNKSGKLKVFGKMFVDATGDADICQFAKEKTVRFSENRKASWYYYYNGEKVVLSKLAEKLWRPIETRPYDGLDYRDIAAMCIDGRKAILEEVLELREKTNANVVPTTLPTIPLFRMTRRIDGLYTLSDREDKAYFEDSIGMTGDWRNAGPCFHIPYRCLIGKTKNLITAGRNISVTEDMWDITRVIPTCAVTGEAAGCAAALAAKEEVKLQNLDIGLLRETLVGQGVYINKDFGKE